MSGVVDSLYNHSQRFLPPGVYTFCAISFECGLHLITCFKRIEYGKNDVSLLRLGYKRPTSICLALALCLSLAPFCLLAMMMQVVEGALPSGGPNVADKAN